MVWSRRSPHLRRLSAVVVGGGLVAVLVVALAAGGSEEPDPQARRSSAPSATPGTDRPEPSPIALGPTWPHRLTIVSDSVGLGSITALREAMSAWRVRVVGRPALMLDDAADELGAGGRLDRVVVIALGYNSLWERHRVDHDVYAARFDRDAERLLRTVRRQGARKVVWVTLRDAARRHVPRDAWHQHAVYAWYFPYVNERLRRLDRHHDEMVLADWAAVSDRSGITYDAFHLDPDGAALYARTLREAVLEAEIAPAH